MATIHDWRGLYSTKWNGEIVPEAYAHPAKFNRGLIRRIYDHAQAQGYIAAGSRIVDPFGGVALGALEAMLRGMFWTGCELKQKFVDLGNANLALWRTRYATMLRGNARLLQGDSRRLCEAVAQAEPIIPITAQPSVNSER